MPIKVELPPGTVEYAPLLLFGAGMLAFAKLNLQQNAGPVTVTINAVDVSNGNAALSGVSCTLAGITGTTDSTGVVALVIPAADIGTTQTLTASLTGYTSYVDQITIPSSNFNQSALMVQSVVTTYTLTVNAIDGTNGNAPLAGVLVVFGSAQATTPSNGIVVLSNIPPSTSATLTASLAGYNTYTQDLTINQNTSQTAIMTVIAATTYTLTINAVDVSNGNAALPGVLCTFGSGSATTNASGIAVITSIPSGTSATLTASLAGYVTYSQALTITINTNQTALMVPVQAAVQIHFTAIRTDTNAALPGVLIQVQNPQGTVEKSGTTSSTGKLTLTLTASGVGQTRVIVAALTGYETYNDSFTVPTSSFNQTVLMVPNVVISVTGTFNAVDTSNGNAALSGVLVTFERQSGTTSGSGGSVSIPNLSPGFRGNIVATKSGYNTYTNQITVPTSNFSQSILMVAQTGSITGMFNAIRTDTNAALPGVLVTIEGQQGITGANGSVSIPNLVAGPAGNLIGSLSGFTTYTDQFTVPTSSFTQTILMVPVVAALTLLPTTNGTWSPSAQPITVINSGSSAATYIIGITPFGQSTVFSSSFTVNASNTQNINPGLNLNPIVTSGTMACYNVLGTAKLSADVPVSW